MNKNLPNRKSIRLQTWDYRENAPYFITICTKEKLHYFGKIENNKMIYSPIGAIANVLWYEMKNRNKHIELGEFVVMPNHIHGILILQNNNPVGTGQALSVVQAPIGKHRYQNIGKNSVSSIVGGYKSAVTKHANRLGLEFAWQPRFYENIIRNEKAYNNIAEYINNNPLNWNKDRFYS